MTNPVKSDSDRPEDRRPQHRAFDGLADTYAAHRPSYPPVLFSAMLEGLPRPTRALDVGCGTGISSRLLADAGAHVVGIDPNPDMLAAARRSSPTTLAFRHGSAERTGCPDASVDLILAAQAFHWFDPAAALEEFARVLRAGGRVALLWNIRIADGGFTDDYGRIVASAGEHVDPSQRAARAALDAALVTSRRFHVLRRMEVENDVVLDEEGAIGRAVSASYFPRREPERSQTIEALRCAVRRHATNGHVVVRHVARLTLAERDGSPG